MEDTALNIKWNNHDREVACGVEVLRSNTLYSDVTLACGGKLYPVHKFLLGTCSEYFSQMFTSPTTQSLTVNNFIVLITDIQQYELECILNFMYLGEMHVIESSLPNVIRAAKKLQVKGLGTLEQCLGENTPPVHSVQVSSAPAQSATYTPQEPSKSQDTRSVANLNDYQDAFSTSVPQDFVTSVLGDGSTTPTADPGSVNTPAILKRRKKDELPRLVPAQALLREPLPPHANRRLDTIGPPVRVGYTSNLYTTQMPRPSLTNSLVAPTTTVTDSNPKIRVAAFARMDEEASAAGTTMMRPPLVYMGHRYGIPQNTLRNRAHGPLVQGNAMPRLISQGSGMQGTVSQQGNGMQASGLQAMGAQGNNLTGMVVQGSGMQGMVSQGSTLSGIASQGSGMPVILSYGSALASMASQVGSGGHSDMLASRIGQAGVLSQNNGLAGMLSQRGCASSIGSQGSRAAAMISQAGRVPGMVALGSGAIGMHPQAASSMGMLSQTNLPTGMLPQGGGSNGIMPQGSGPPGMLPQGSGQTAVPQASGVHNHTGGLISTPNQISGSSGALTLASGSSGSVTQTSGSSGALTHTSVTVAHTIGSGTTHPLVTPAHTQVSTASGFLPLVSGQGNTQTPGSLPLVSLVNASTRAEAQPDKGSVGTQQGSKQVPSTSQILRPAGIVPLGSEPPGIVLEGLGCMTEIILDDENQHASVEEGEPHEIVLQGQGSGPPHVVSQRNGSTGSLSQEFGYRLAASAADRNNSNIFLPGSVQPGLIMHGSVPPSVFGIDIDQIPVEMITGKKKRKRDPDKAYKRKMKADGEKSPSKPKQKKRKQVFPPTQTVEDEQVLIAILRSKHENLKKCHVRLERLHICGPCGLPFKTLREYNNHYRSYHGEEPPGMGSAQDITSSSVSNKQEDKVGLNEGKGPKMREILPGGGIPRKAAAATVLGANVTTSKGKEVGQEMQIVIEKVLSRAEGLIPSRGVETVDKVDGEDLHMEVVDQTEPDDFNEGIQVTERKMRGTEITIERAPGRQRTFELSNRPEIHTGAEGLPQPNREALGRKELMHVPEISMEESTLEMHCTIEEEPTSGIKAALGIKPPEIHTDRENNAAQTLPLGSQSTGRTLKDKEPALEAGGKSTPAKTVTEDEPIPDRLNTPEGQPTMERESTPEGQPDTEREPTPEQQTTLTMECSEEPSPMDKVVTEEGPARLVARTAQHIPSTDEIPVGMGSLLLGDSSGLESTVESELGPETQIDRGNELTHEVGQGSEVLPKSRVEESVSQAEDSGLENLQITLTSGL